MLPTETFYPKPTYPTAMKKSDINPMPAFFDRYINLVEDVDLLEALETHTPEALFSETDLLEALGDSVYAPGKWTIKDIIQHCIDTERIMSCLLYTSRCV